LTPIFFRREGVGEAAAVGEGVAVGEPAGVGEGETTALIVTDAGEGGGVGDCAWANAARARSAVRIGMRRRGLDAGPGGGFDREFK
jgi:hypothetical protein